MYASARHSRDNHSSRSSRSEDPSGSAQHNAHHTCGHRPLPARDGLHDAAGEVHTDGTAAPRSEHTSATTSTGRVSDEIVIADRGVPIVRPLGLTATATLERLAADGVIARGTVAP